MTKRKLSEAEMEMLRIIWSLGGETTEEAVADEMRMPIRWARVYMAPLGKADLLDINKAGRIKMTYKGRHALGVPEPGLQGKPAVIKTEPESIQISAIRSLWLDRREGWR